MNPSHPARASTASAFVCKSIVNAFSAGRCPPDDVVLLPGDVVAPGRRSSVALTGEAGAILHEILAAGQGRFTKALNHAHCRKWDAYSSPMLERDWRDPQRRTYDLSFRSLLILHYVEIKVASPLFPRRRARIVGVHDQNEGTSNIDCAYSGD